MNIIRKTLLVLTLLPVAGLLSTASLAQTAKLGATVFSYDGQDFIRGTTNMVDDGKSAANTKLDHNSPAYKALIKNHAYSGPATVFGQDYQATYAPLVGDDGKLTGALFVGVPK